MLCKSKELVVSLILHLIFGLAKNNTLSGKFRWFLQLTCLSIFELQLHRTGIHVNIMRSLKLIKTIMWLTMTSLEKFCFSLFFSSSCLLDNCSVWWEELSLYLNNKKLSSNKVYRYIYFKLKYSCWKLKYEFKGICQLPDIYLCISSFSCLMVSCSSFTVWKLKFWI